MWEQINTDTQMMQFIHTRGKTTLLCCDRVEWRHRGKEGRVLNIAPVVYGGAGGNFHAKQLEGHSMFKDTVPGCLRRALHATIVEMRGSKDGGGCHAMDWCWTWEAVPDLPSSK
jgi:hypothetical protein